MKLLKIILKHFIEGSKTNVWEVGAIPADIYMTSPSRDRMIEAVKNGECEGLEYRTDEVRLRNYSTE